MHVVDVVVSWRQLLEYRCRLMFSHLFYCKSLVFYFKQGTTIDVSSRSYLATTWLCWPRLSVGVYARIAYVCFPSVRLFVPSFPTVSAIGRVWYGAKAHSLDRGQYAASVTLRPEVRGSTQTCYWPLGVFCGPVIQGRLRHINDGANAPWKK